MTKLKDPVRRTTTIMLDNRAMPRPEDEVTVTLYPAGLIGFRPKRSRKEYTLPFETVYRQAIRAEVQSERVRKTVKRGLMALERESVQ